MPADRACVTCGGSMAGRYPTAKRCGSVECARAGQQERTKRYLLKRGPREATARAKACRGCLRDLPASAFYRNRSKGDGLSTRCKECARRYRETRRAEDARNKQVAYLLRRDDILAQKREHVQRFGRATANERQRQYYRANRERIRAACKGRREERRRLAWDEKSRRCVCGKAIGPERWFCSVACKAATAKEIVGLNRTLEEESDGAYQPKTIR